MTSFQPPASSHQPPASSFQLPAPSPTRLVLASGLVIALCIVGDSYLYSILPLEAANLGIALPLVGILLSANRLVRLISNTWASGLFERWGPKRPFAAATVLALLTTAVYALGRGFAFFLPARLGWGIAWSGLRQGGYQAVWTGGSAQRGRLMGLLWGIIRLGSAVSVVAGGYLRDRFGYQTGVLAIMGATVLAIPLALSLRWPSNADGRPLTDDGRPLAGLQEMWRSTLGRRALIAGFVYALVEGVLISTASLFLASRLGTGELLAGLGARVGTVAGLLLAVRWTSDIVFGPSIGALADRLGHPPAAVLLAATLLAGVIGVTQLSGAGMVLCLMVAFVSSAGLTVTLGAIANGLALAAEHPHHVIGAYTTAGDAGSALGPPLAYSAGVLISIGGMYVAGAIALLTATLWYWRASRRTR
ncbi:MAG: MFS transporter [Chloroflexi bacterium]|nr:MFS transporter [Chloroflexota bacterium]